jgi:hypothetical protein
MDRDMSFDPYLLKALLPEFNQLATEFPNEFVAFVKFDDVTIENLDWFTTVFLDLGDRKLRPYTFPREGSRIGVDGKIRELKAPPPLRLSQFAAGQEEEFLLWEIAAIHWSRFRELMGRAWNCLPQDAYVPKPLCHFTGAPQLRIRDAAEFWPNFVANQLRDRGKLVAVENFPDHRPDVAYFTVGFFAASRLAIEIFLNQQGPPDICTDQQKLADSSDARKPHNCNYLRLFDAVIGLFKAVQEDGSVEPPNTVHLLEIFDELMRAMGIDRKQTWKDNYERLGLVERTGKSLQSMARGAFAFLDPANRRGWGLGVMKHALLDLWKQLDKPEQIVLQAHYQAAISIYKQLRPVRALWAKKNAPITLNDDGKELTHEEMARSVDEFRAHALRDTWEVDACFSKWAEGHFDRTPALGPGLLRASNAQLVTLDLSETEQEIMKLVRNQRMKGETISQKLGLSYDYTRQVLSKMSRKGLVANGKDGYYATK